MKNVLTLMLGLVATTASFAHSTTATPATSETRLVLTSDQNVKFYVQALGTKGKVIIWNANGQALYSETVNLQRGLKQQFDLSNVGAGTYHFTLLTPTQTITKTVVMQPRPNQSFIVQES